MVEKKKTGLGGLGIAGLILGFMGAVYLILGVCLWMNLEEEVSIIGIIFTAVGGLLLLLALIFLMIVLKKHRNTQKLVEAGRYIWGDVVDCVPNYNVRVNGRHPYRLIVQYRDAMGVIHVFKSRDIYTYIVPEALNRKVKVYVSEDYKQYYVDADAALALIVEH